ncbi:hypothetical protein BpHYR1_010711 [Brachionus plicatilis]|uniref:Uncharacterized protein n=1 Tax=Brachionus plicatilis TaxID=10195 RepID=A0A3M7SKL6_BRAPC|nr:hypothetical protein BpHYR1_010711 [Brachionus plicatilis]
MLQPTPFKNCFTIHSFDEQEFLQISDNQIIRLKKVTTLIYKTRLYISNFGEEVEHIIDSFSEIKNLKKNKNPWQKYAIHLTVFVHLFQFYSHSNGMNVDLNFIKLTQSKLELVAENNISVKIWKFLFENNKTQIAGYKFSVQKYIFLSHDKYLSLNRLWILIEFKLVESIFMEKKEISIKLNKKCVDK